jgi:TonB family protein
MNGSVTGTLAGMRRSAMLLTAVGLIFSATDIVGQSAGASSRAVASSQYAKGGTEVAPWGQTLATDILSDTQGVDFAPYLKKTSQTIKGTWLPLLPDEAQLPFNQQSETIIRFTISPDGKISAMHLDGGSHQVKFDRAAWGAITSVGQFSPLPANFHGPDLELRIHFRVNSPATP